MTDRKFTEDELVELLRAYVERMCGKCNVKDLGNCCNSCFLLPISQSADLIERQKAEIERYKENMPYLEQQSLDFCGVLCDFAEELIAKYKSEAVKKFADRLKADLGDPFLRAHGCVEPIVNNLVKEMTGGNKA